MSSSKNNSGSPSPSQSLQSIGSDDGDDYEEIQEEVTSKTSLKSLQITANNEPCCSKSLPRHVRFSDADDPLRGKVKTEYIVESRVPPKKQQIQPPPPLTPLPPAIHTLYLNDEIQPQYQNGEPEIGNDKTDSFSDDNELSQVESGEPILRAFSDTVLVLPNLHEYEETNNKDDNEQQISRLGNNENIMSATKLIELVRKEHRKPDESFSKLPTIHDDQQLDPNNNEKNEQNVDKNNNAIWPADAEAKLFKHASYLFHKDRRADIERLTKLMPRGREYVIFNIFGDFARLIGLRARKKHVAFPEEFLEKYEQQGDVAGKGRFVPTAKQPYKGLQTSTKKRKLSAVYSSWTVKSGLFVPHMERVDDDTRCEVCCEKFLHSPCSCGAPKKPDTVQQVMEGYWNDLNTASIFLHGHATQTFEFAMSNLEFLRLHEPVSVAGQTPWSPNYSKLRLGVLAGSVWAFTYSIRTIIQDVRVRDASQNLASLPSETNFRKVMEQFATLCLTISENVRLVLQYNHNFYNFCKECRRILKVLKIHIGFKGDIKVKPPFRRGDGLELMRTLSKRNIAREKGIHVMVARTSKRVSSEEADLKEQEVEEEVEWKKFEELTGTEKSMSLRHLLNVTQEGMSMVQTQVRFLVDDIVDTTMDESQPDLLFVMADMYDRIKFLENIGMRNVKSEFEQISKAMTEFCNDLQSFINYGQHIIKRFIELRDMVHLSYEFMVNGLNLEILSEMVPSTTFKKKRNVGCCGTKKTTAQKGPKKVVDRYEPKYKPMDFFRVYYQDLVKCKGEVQTSRFNFRFEMSEQTLKEILPSGSQNNWGDVDLPSPRLSFDNEYVDKDFDDDWESGAGDKEKEQVLKPILVGVAKRESIDATASIPTPTPTPTATPTADENEVQISQPPPQQQPNETAVDSDEDKGGGNK